jgi:ribosome biogenesis SPOUT family RNA methylase Rps3
MIPDFENSYSRTPSMLFVIEHLEPKLSEWLRIEYSHAARIVGRKRLLITNVKKKSEFRKLAKIAHVEHESAREMFKHHEFIVLDPRARKKLSPHDFQSKKAVIIGGILGDDPPLGRTRELLTKTLQKTPTRNLGKKQLSIDGATYVAKRVSEGKLLRDIPLQHGLEIQVSEVYSIFLPYAFPLARGKPLISSELISYLKRR